MRPYYIVDNVEKRYFSKKKENSRLIYVFKLFYYFIKNFLALDGDTETNCEINISR